MRAGNGNGNEDENVCWCYSVRVCDNLRKDGWMGWMDIDGAGDLGHAIRFGSVRARKGGPGYRDIWGTKRAAGKCQMPNRRVQGWRSAEEEKQGSKGRRAGRACGEARRSGDEVPLLEPVEQAAKGGRRREVKLKRINGRA